MNMRRRRRIAKSHRISRADDFAPVCPSKGLRSNGATFLCMSASQRLYGTALDADLRTRGVSTLVMAGISTTGVVLSSVAWASDADYDVRLVQDCCYDPDRDAHEALLRSGFGGRVQVV
ncbi:isochorismatase family protein [Escherichia coli]|uniref:cysteine hydrolase family protein n=2 Tax=Enterobacterales TaxID=91347 RepID=UPI0030C89AAA